MKIIDNRNLILPALIGGVIALCVHAQAAGPTFTTAQSEQGKSAYAQNCASCHGQDLDDGEFAPPLKGVSFIQQWGGRSADGLFTYIGTMMPPANRGGLGAETYTQLLAYLLEVNGVQPGNQPLPSDVAALKTMMVPGPVPTPGRGGPGGGLSPYADASSLAGQTESARQNHAGYRRHAAQSARGATG